MASSELLEEIIPMPQPVTCKLYIERPQLSRDQAFAIPSSEKWQLQGYPKLANLLGHYPDAAIFRRFGGLGMLNLLSLQAELLSIETELRSLWMEDDASPDQDPSMYTRDFYRLHHSKSPDDDQLKLLKQSREKLCEYYSLLSQMQQLSQMSPPRPDQLEFIRQWQIDSNNGNAFLQGREVDTWADQYDDDFVTFEKSDDERSQFAKWLSPTLLHWYESRFGRASHRHNKYADLESSRIVDERDSRTVLVTKFLGYTFAVVFASLLPVLAILALYNEKSTPNRIYITIGFTAAIGLWLSAFTSAKVNEVFAATAAFAAIEVVFIGTNG